MSIQNFIWKIETFVDVWLYVKRFPEKQVPICVSAANLQAYRKSKVRKTPEEYNTSCDLGSVVAALVRALDEQTPQARLDMLHEVVDLGFRHADISGKRLSLNDLLLLMVRSAADLVQISEELSCNTDSKCNYQESFPKYLQASWVSRACSQCMRNTMRRQIKSYGGLS